MVAAANSVRLMRFKLIENNRLADWRAGELESLILCNKSTRSSQTAGGKFSVPESVFRLAKHQHTGYTAQLHDWFLQQNT